MNSPLDETEMAMSPGDLPRLTLRGRGADTLKPPKPRFRLNRSSSAPDNQHPAYDELVSAHEELNAPQFGRRFAKADGELAGMASRKFRVETRPRSRANGSR